MKIIDTFLFHGDWVVKMRLDFLSPYVDEFVIVESWYTFSGEKKEFLFKDRWADLWKPYADKIHWVVLDECPTLTDTWVQAYRDHPLFREEKKEMWFREQHQRDAALAYIQETYAGEDYMVHVGNAGEIPNVDVFHPDAKETMLQKLGEIRQPLYLEMAVFYYNFYWKKPYHWYRSYLIGKTQLAEKPSLTYWRWDHMPTMVLRGAGWCLHYFMDVADIQRKVRASHEDEKWADAGHIKECIAQGKDLFLRGEKEALLHEENPSLPETLSAYRGEIDYIQMS
jgi:hypothetical protein